MEVFFVLWFFVLGLVLGSFFNVVVYRLPRKLSLIRPGSSCPHCGHRLSAGELVPIVSFLLQKGRCRECREPIAWRYPLVELVTGLGFALIALHSTSFSELVVGVVFFSLLLLLALIDFAHKLLLNVLTVPGIIIGLLFSLLGWTMPFWHSVLGAGAGFLLMFLIALISRGGMGMGDVKLMAMIGAFLGWRAVFLVLFGASVVGSIGGILYIYLTKQDRKTPIPFGPALALATLVCYFLC